MSSTTIEVLLQSLINALKEEYFLIPGLEKDAIQLQKTLFFLQSYLNDADRKSITQTAVKNWLMELERVSFDSDNVFDELSYNILHNRVNKMKSTKFKDKILSCFSSYNHIAHRQNMALTIKQINTGFGFLHRRATCLSLQCIIVNAPAAAYVTTSFTDDPIFIGRDDDTIELVLMLTHIPEVQIFSILTIVGMGGVGKTTLTRKVFNHDNVKARYRSLFWVHVSQTFDPFKIFKDILSMLTQQTATDGDGDGDAVENNGDGDGVENKESILKKLHEGLKDKTYLLVLDDVWNEDSSRWEEFIKSISDVTSTKGNGIIITTRNHMCASIVKPTAIHNLNVLSDEDCWSIVKVKTFKDGDVPPGFEMIGRMIAKRCQGLPLAANVVAGVLSRKSEEEWHFINDYWLSDGEGGENISKILKLSYDHLPSPSLKKCFAYCSIFPEGHKIVKRELIELWMAEGFLQPDQENDMEDVGNEFLRILLHNSLLLVAEISDFDGHVVSCVMLNNLVHNMASSVLGSDMADGQTRYMWLKEESSPIPKQIAKHLRTLFLEDAIHGTMFSDLQCLHNLTLAGYGVKELPNSIRKLIHLRNLNISKSRITEIPDWIGELHHLQTLRANSLHLKKLPSALKHLINLRHLHICSWIVLPAEIGRLTCLQTLKNFSVGNNRGYQIEELGSLKNLKGELHICGLEMVHDKEEAHKANIYQKSKLSELWLEWNADREGETKDECVLEGLQPHPNLKKLAIKGFKGKRFSLWIEKMAVGVGDGTQGSWVPLHSLIEITLSDCQECEDIPKLENLPNLKSLSLFGLKKVKCINSSFNNLRSLRVEELEGLECLPDWLFYKNQTLSYLTISFCLKLRELPDGLDTLNSLEKLNITNCPNLKSVGNPSVGEGKLQGILHELEILKCKELKELPCQMIESWVLSLEILKLSELWSLENLPMVLYYLTRSTRLRKLEIKGVPKFMAAYSVDRWAFGSLVELKIDVSKKWSREIGAAVKETVDGVLRGCRKSLTRLWLRGVEDWKEWLPGSIQHLTLLSWLQLENLEVEELPQWFGNLSSLTHLSLSSCNKLRHLHSGELLTKLQHLDLKDCPKLYIDSKLRSTPHLTIKVDGRSIGFSSNEIVDEGMSSAATEVLLQNLINAFKEECFLIRGLDEEAQELQMTLDKIRSYLNDAEKKSITTDAAKIWLRDLEDVAFNADNVLDELNYHILHNKVKKMKSPKPKAMDKVVSGFSSLNDIARPRNALRIKQINMDFEPMNKMATSLHLQSTIVTAPAAASHASFETNSFTHDPIFIGRDDDVTKLVEKLTHIPEEQQIFFILAIVGVSGMGKTMLTRKVFNHERTSAGFGSHIWVHVSQTFDPIMLLKKILSTLTSETVDGVETEESILKKLLQVLKAKTYLLVLDDVWIEDLQKWDHFINSITKVTSTKGNAIIITTRDDEVASLVGPLHIHHLNGLSDEDSWSLITAKTFLGKGRFESIGRKIAQISWGLPLIANVVGGVLQQEQDWLSIEHKWFPDVEGYGRFNSLRLSFNNLYSPSLKQCFAYCSIFPKGCRILKQELVELWMAEGFLQSDERNDMESVGNNLFNFLLRSSLLLVEDRDAYGNVESCVMHDLVHDLASSVLGSSDGINQVRYLIHGDDDSSPIPENKAKYLRTLIYQGEVSGTMFSTFISLRALTLDCHQVIEFPSSIHELIYLRKLNISRTRIGKLPDWISELHYLQTLNAFTESLGELPGTLKYLISLRHIYIPSHVRLPPEIGTLTELQELKFRVGEQKGYRIEELGSLKNLKQLYIYNLEKVDDEEEAKKAKLLEKQNLISLQFSWGEYGEGERNEERSSQEKTKGNEERVLESLQPYSNLERLKIMGFKGKRFPSWIPQIENLKNITLSRCQGCEKIPTLSHLSNLKSLHLWTLCNVKFIDSSLYDRYSSGEVIFPALESIVLSDMPELRKWAEVDDGEIHPCEVMFPCLQSLKIYHCKNLECLPTWLFNKARNLKELDIRHCSKLRELPDGLHALNFLEQMTIKGCQNLKSIVYASGGGEPQGSLTFLRSLEIRDCQKLEVLVGSFAPLLQKVTMAGLKSLKNLAGFLDCLAESVLLEEMTIVGVPNFMSTSSVKSWPFHKLLKLEIDVSREWSRETNVAIETVDSILQNCCSSLCELKLTGLEIWKCVPESIGNLTALDSLELGNFEVEKLPEWFENLSSLSRLCLSDFTKLQRLPSMKRLTKLQELHIHDCPELRIESERHNISIYVNGHPL